MNRSSLKLIAAVMITGCLLIIGIGRIVNNDMYHLNKTVRLISMRMSQIDMLSFRRRKEYRITFYKNNYTIGSRSDSEWMALNTHPYASTIQSSMAGLEVRLRNGRISELWLKTRPIRSTRTAVIELLYPHNPDKNRSILLNKEKGWRVLY